MRTDLASRTLILTTWLVALLYTGTGTRAALLAVAIGALWVAPIVRDRLTNQRMKPSDTA